MIDEPGTWQRKVYERHLDLMLAEELECNPAFALWMHLQCLKPEELPGGEITKSEVSVSHLDTIGNDASAAGETDLLVESTWASGAMTRLLIEDKIDAVLQPRQIERYEQRLELHRKEVHAAGGIVVAPESYLHHRESELGSLALVSVESIAAILKVQSAASLSPLSERLAWRADRLILMKQESPPSPDHQESVAVRDWFIDCLHERDSSIVPNARSMRTINGGWLYFVEPKAIIYKLIHGFVDIYLRDVWPDAIEMQEIAHASGDLPDGFKPSTDNGNNLILRGKVHRPTTTTELCSSGNLENSNELSKALDACVVAAQWIRGQQSRPTPGDE